MYVHKYICSVIILNTYVTMLLKKKIKTKYVNSCMVCVVCVCMKEIEELKTRFVGGNKSYTTQH